ncbi:hypothetical protein P43SY_006579 [Pythium insidiosum]|uniref:Chitin-binding type-4 domain-containing protein n=1 Tax=Pythium insidiosum TaxID=114742 RepID=A0AAD5LYS4_PYTIN|nr:hypothetical protein P43SY_006579 [Pythium insidiosum]
MARFGRFVLLAALALLLLPHASAHSALLSNGKLLGQLNGGSCFNCAIGSFPRPTTIPASAVDSGEPADGIAAYLKSSGQNVKDAWLAFQTGAPYGKIVEPEALVDPSSPSTCGRFQANAEGVVAPDAAVTFKKSNHQGPAEIWVDDRKTWAVDNFVAERSVPASAFQCRRPSCHVRWYWMGKVRVKRQWDHYQLYVQCFVVKGNGSAPVEPGTVKPRDER